MPSKAERKNIKKELKSSSTAFSQKNRIMPVLNLITEDVQGIRGGCFAWYDLVLCLFRSVKAVKTKICFHTILIDDMC